MSHSLKFYVSSLSKMLSLDFWLEQRPGNIFHPCWSLFTGFQSNIVFSLKQYCLFIKASMVWLRNIFLISFHFIIHPLLRSTNSLRLIVPRTRLKLLHRIICINDDFKHLGILFDYVLCPRFNIIWLTDLLYHIMKYLTFLFSKMCVFKCI